MLCPFLSNTFTHLSHTFTQPVFLKKKIKKKKKKKEERKKEKKVSQLVSWFFKPSQPQRIISGLKKTFINRYNIVERTNKAEIRPEEQSEKAESCRGE